MVGARSGGEPLGDSAMPCAGTGSVRGVRIHPVLALRRGAGRIVAFRLSGASRCAGMGGRSRGGCGGGRSGCWRRRGGCRCVRSRGRSRGRRGSGRRVGCGRGRDAAVAGAGAASTLGRRAIGARDRRRAGRRLVSSGGGLGVHASMSRAGAATRCGRGRAVGAHRTACTLGGGIGRDSTESGERRCGEKKAHTHRDAPEEVAREARGEGNTPVRHIASPIDSPPAN